jgi:hypothetical protein
VFPNVPRNAGTWSAVLRHKCLTAEFAAEEAKMIDHDFELECRTANNIIERALDSAIGEAVQTEVSLECIVMTLLQFACCALVAASNQSPGEVGLCARKLAAGFVKMRDAELLKH